MGKRTAGHRTNQQASKPKRSASPAITYAGKASTSSQVQDEVFSSQAGTRNTVNNESFQPHIPTSPSPHHDQLEQSSLTSFFALRAFLSYAPHGEQDVPTYNKKEFISIVNSVLADDSICYLTGKEFSSLIKLLGTLSILPASTKKYNSRRISLIIPTLPHSHYWTLVARIAEAKAKRGEGLTASDHYWLMRMELASVPDIAPVKLLSREFFYVSLYRVHYSFEANAIANCRRPNDPVARAHHHYTYIRRQSTEPEVHAPLLESLLLLNTPKDTYLAMKIICELLSWSYEKPHRRLLELLWRIILKPESHLPTDLKQRLLATLTRRVDRQKRLQEMTDFAKEGVSHSTCNAQSQCIFPIRDLNGAPGVSKLADALASIIFPRAVCHRCLARSIQAWALTQCLIVLAPQRLLKERWNSLVLFALSQSAPGSERDEIVNSTSSSMGQGDGEAVHTMNDWDVISVLASLQRSLPGKALQSLVQALGRKLWRMWYIDSQALSRPVYVARAIATSLFNLVSIGQDKELLDAVTQYCHRNELWRLVDSDPVEINQVGSLAAEYLGALRTCYGTPGDSLFVTLEDRFDGSVPHSVFKEVFHNFVNSDPRMALELYSIANNRGFKLPDGSDHRLALSLVSNNLIDEALPFFRNAMIGHDRQRELLTAILAALEKRQSRILHPDVAAIILGAMRTTYSITIPPLEDRKVVQFALVALIVSKYVNESIAIFDHIHQKHPQFFSDAFLRRFSRILIKYRQYGPAFLAMTTLSPRTSASALTRNVRMIGLGRYGVNHKTYRLLEWMARWIDCRFKTPPHVSTLRLSSLSTKHLSNGDAVQFAMRCLVRYDRRTAARRLFLRTWGHLSDSVRTDLGNVILDGYICARTTRNRRKIRNVLRIFKILRRDCGFIPDGITVNTLIKALLHFRQRMDTGLIKGLFNHLAKSGYFGQRILAQDPKFVLFDGVSASVYQPFGLPPIVESRTFADHIKPLLRMFIKAFFVRRDVAAVQRVTGILKREEMSVLEIRDRRRKQRIAGTIWPKGFEPQ